MAQPQVTGNILALDVGQKRIGVALAHHIARLPRPLQTLNNDDAVWQALKEIIAAEEVAEIVVGLPRNLSGNDTAQTAYATDFADKLQQAVQLPIHFQDEALTSVQAEQELAARGRQFAKGDIDALAAVYILEDFLGQRSGQ